MSSLRFGCDVDFLAFFDEGQRVSHGHFQFFPDVLGYGDLEPGRDFAGSHDLGHVFTKIGKTGKIYKPSEHCNILGVRFPRTEKEGKQGKCRR